MQTVLITGVSRGIGREVAQKFLSEGFCVFGTSTSGTADYEHENLRLFKLDLRSSESINECVTELKAAGTELDIVINNAGVLLDEDDEVITPNKLRQTLEVNLIGTASFTEEILGLVKKNGHIVFISSTAGSIERTGRVIARFPSKYPSYKISKTALNMYMRTLAVRLKKTSITVSALHPGWVKTDMGGEEADISPEESAEDVYRFAVSTPETGHFWFKGEQLPW